MSATDFMRSFYACLFICSQKEHYFFRMGTFDEFGTFSDSKWPVSLDYGKPDHLVRRKSY